MNHKYEGICFRSRDYKFCRRRITVSLLQKKKKVSSFYVIKFL